MHPPPCPSESGPGLRAIGMPATFDAKYGGCPGEKANDDISEGLCHEREPGVDEQTIHRVVELPVGQLPEQGQAQMRGGITIGTKSTAEGASVPWERASGGERAREAAS